MARDKQRQPGRGMGARVGGWHDERGVTVIRLEQLTEREPGAWSLTSGLTSGERRLVAVTMTPGYEY